MTWLCSSGSGYTHVPSFNRSQAPAGYVLADKSPVLKDVSLHIQPGQLVMVTGPVGSGKSSLLAAILGELHGAQAQVSCEGSVAYTAQDPWVCHATYAITRHALLLPQIVEVE